MSKKSQARFAFVAMSNIIANLPSVSAPTLNCRLSCLIPVTNQTMAVDDAMSCLSVRTESPHACIRYGTDFTSSSTISRCMASTVILSGFPVCASLLVRTHNRFFNL